MQRGLRVRYLYHDNDLLEVEVSASNGSFAGTTALYVSRDELSRSADAIGGFPNSRSDEREITWGTFGPASAGGATRLHLQCTDSAMHVQLSVQIEDTEGTQTSSLVAHVEPAAIDNFIPQLKTIEEVLDGEAVLEFERR